MFLFDNGGFCYLVGNGKRIPVRVTEIHSAFGETPEFKGHFCGCEHASGGIIPVEKSPIKNVIFNDPATVVIWEDGTKTVVKCQPGDTYSKETGLALCIAKKSLGNKSNFNEVFKRWIPEEETVEEETVETQIVETQIVETPVVRSERIKVGDKVKVVNCGRHYPSYRSWLYDYVEDPDDRRKWSSDRRWTEGAIGVVKYIGPHDNFTGNGYLAYVEIGDQCSIIGFSGLEKVEEG